MSENEQVPEGRPIIRYVWLNRKERRIIHRDPQILELIRADNLSPCDAQLATGTISMARIRQGKKCRRWKQCKERENRTLCVQRIGLIMVQNLLNGSTFAYELDALLNTREFVSHDWVTAELHPLKGIENVAQHILTYAFRILDTPAEEVVSEAPLLRERFDPQRRPVLVLGDLIAVLDDLATRPKVGTRVEFWPLPSRDPDEQRSLRALQGVIIEVQDPTLPPPQPGEERLEGAEFGHLPTVVIKTEDGQQHERIILDVAPVI
jgi:hypothetical protein